MGDNPACSTGPPISLGWSYHDEKRVEVGEYEEEKFQRQNKKDFRLPSSIRKKILQTLGYSKKEINFAIYEILVVKDQREESRFTYHEAEAEDLLNTFLELIYERLSPFLFFYTMNSLTCCGE